MIFVYWTVGIVAYVAGALLTGRIVYRESYEGWKDRAIMRMNPERLHEQAMGEAWFAAIVWPAMWLTIGLLWAFEGLSRLHLNPFKWASEFFTRDVKR